MAVTSNERKPRNIADGLNSVTLTGQEQPLHCVMLPTATNSTHNEKTQGGGTGSRTTLNPVVGIAT